MRLSRRKLVAGVAALGAGLAAPSARLRAAAEQRFDFTKPLEGWQIVTGTWAIEAMGDAATGHALVQRATNNTFNVIVAPGGPYEGIEVSVRFKPIAGREDASGGIVFRFAENHYYVIRANALEDNFNFYYYEGNRHQIAGASTKAPALGHWHNLRVRAEGDRIRGWLNEQQLIDRRDQRYKSGQIGLWTKADSITAFDELVVLPLSGS